MADPDVDETDDTEANLGTLTDQDWRDAHERLRAASGFPADELDYVWDPDLDGTELIPAEERVGG